jgi:phenylpyruvate tautomerase PptA (4-oxalocrotonate tautomerase family)
MPIIDIEIVLGPLEIIQNDMVTELADELGEIFHSPSRGTWVKVYGLPTDQYAENGETAVGVYPIFVRIIKSTLPSLEEMQQEVE